MTTTRRQLFRLLIAAPLGVAAAKAATILPKVAVPTPTEEVGIFSFHDKAGRKLAWTTVLLTKKGGCTLVNTKPFVLHVDATGVADNWMLRAKGEVTVRGPVGWGVHLDSTSLMAGDGVNFSSFLVTYD